MLFSSRYSSFVQPVELEEGSILLMKEDCQELLLHEIERNADVKEARVSFTFRKLKVESKRPVTKAEQALADTQRKLEQLTKQFEEYKRVKESEGIRKRTEVDNPLCGNRLSRKKHRRKGQISRKRICKIVNKIRESKQK